MLFRSDLIHALRVAAEEMTRGALCRVTDEVRGVPETQALDSLLASGAFPDTLRYRFRCEECGDIFTLFADTNHGGGNWTREEVA